ncbi:MAG: hypothetical protein ABSH19_03265 [Opitutales bacterium]|jgi:hypothetical protein
MAKPKCIARRALSLPAVSSSNLSNGPVASALAHRLPRYTVAAASVADLATMAKPASAVLKTASFSVTPTSGTISWDITGNGTTDFNLVAHNNPGTASSMGMPTMGPMGTPGFTGGHPGMMPTHKIYALIPVGKTGNGWLGTANNIIAPQASGALIGPLLGNSLFHPGHKTGSLTQSSNAINALNNGQHHRLSLH